MNDPKTMVQNVIPPTHTRELVSHFYNDFIVNTGNTSIRNGE